MNCNVKGSRIVTTSHFCIDMFIVFVRSVSLSHTSRGFLTPTNHQVLCRSFSHTHLTCSISNRPHLPTQEVLIYDSVSSIVQTVKPGNITFLLVHLSLPFIYLNFFIKRLNVIYTTTCFIIHKIITLVLYKNRSKK